VNEQFPVDALQDAGYEVIFDGQKTYNGVAILAKSELTEVVAGVPGYSDPQRRILAATVAGVRIINLYVPNGSAVGSDKFAYKLQWLAEVQQLISDNLQQYPACLVCGDFNIAPRDADVHDPAAWQGSVLVSAEERTALADICGLGFHDVFTRFEPQEVPYSWWDYRQAAFRRNRGLRIDHLLLSTALADQCVSCYVDVTPRSWERPSDHAPVVCVLGRE
jgi:exodeoxyribonuclease-3